MRPSLYLLAAAAAIGTTLAAKPAAAEDASWGCQVLLCAASSNPSWQGVPYCRPPMHKLIAAMKEPGFSWPICHEAKSGKPGFELQEECPEGTITSYSSGDGERGSFLFGRRTRYCSKLVEVDYREAFWGSRRDDDGQDEQYVRKSVDGKIAYYKKETWRAPMRSDPYYFDIANHEGVKQRYYFNLRK